MEKRRFEDVFPKLKEDLSLSKILPFFYAESMVFNEDRTLIHVHTVIDRMVPYEDVRRVEALLKDLYCNEISAVIRLEEFYDLPETYTLETILQGYRDGILKQLSGGRPSLERVLNSASITADDDSVLFSVEDSLFTASYMKQWTEDLKSILHTRFSKNVRVVPEIRKAKKRIHTTEEMLNVVRITEKTEEKSDGAEEKDDPFMNVGRRSASPAGLRKGANKKGSVRRFEPKDPNIVYGRAFSDEPRLLNSFQPNEEGSMTLHAEITAVNVTPLKNGEKTILLLDLTDRTDSISAKIFVPNESLNKMQEKLQPGTTIRIKGSALMDAFEKELVLQNIVGIYLAEPLPENVRTDTAKYKRVELHCHTKMSRVDAIASAKDLVNRAKAWGHKALAITDHGGVYAFPEAYKASRDSGVKILYGMEGYLVDDTVDAVLHPSGLPLSSPTVIFDL